jgi:D-sedoheptulose 7-phosphate isomerase
MNSWTDKINHLHSLLGKLVFTDPQGMAVNCDEGFATLAAKTFDLRRKGGTLYAIGNGASASMASHFTADLAKNGRLHTQVFSDLALITAISNDFSYHEVFAEPLRRRGQAGDVLVAISSSGKSPNILNAVQVANDLGMNVVTLSAMTGDNPLRQLGTLNAYIPATTYGNAETAHAAILHFWIDYLVETQHD